MRIRVCKKCGFILDTKKGLLERDGVCMACINQERKSTIDFKGRQEWLDKYLKENRTNPKYDCLVAVSGGKDSCAIVKRLVEKHNCKNPLLVSIMDEFTQTKAGVYNLDNLVRKYKLDLITVRCNPDKFVNETRESFFNELHPLKWFEEQIYKIPIEIAHNYNIKVVFFGENSSFEYGMSEELEIFHPLSDDKVKVVYFGAIYPYSITDSLNEAKEMGFKTLNDLDDWRRKGNIEDYTQISSIGYIIQIWTKFIKFGYQRVSDIACRFVREGVMTKEEAEEWIKREDFICDPLAKMDFCKTIGIDEKEFDEVINRFANKDLLEMDITGCWRRKDLI